MLRKLSLVLGLASSAFLVRAGRQDLQPGTRNVHLLFVRHSLSCRDVVELWSPPPSTSFQASGGLDIRDPLLSGIGESASRASRTQIQQWLTDEGLTVDAVLSSAMLREMQTGLLMYPDIKPLHVVPFLARIREGGPANLAKVRHQQVADLVNALPPGFQVNYKWLERYGQTEGTYKQFSTFLEQSFLPELAKAKPAGAPIVLVVVAHDDYIMQAVEHQCGTAWDRKPKFMFNQVLHGLSKFGLAQHTAAHSLKMQQQSPDVTEHRALSANHTHQCEFLHEGLLFPPQWSGKFCLPDVGERCMLPIKHHSNYQDSLWTRLVEKEIWETAQEIAATETDIAEAGSSLVRLGELFAAADARGSLACFGSPLTGCHPANVCEWGFLSMSCTVNQDADPDKLRDRMLKVRDSIHAMEIRSVEAQMKLDELRKTECWSGGRPEPEHYQKFFGLRASDREQALVLAKAN